MTQTCIVNVIRKDYNENNTIGDLFINGKWFCYTLEDKVRPEGVKIYGDTAIPEGTYKMVLNHSNRFNKILPLLIGVPGFSGIRAHGGNNESDTSGCILVAKNRDADSIWEKQEDELVKALSIFDDVLWVVSGYR